MLLKLLLGQDVYVYGNNPFLIIELQGCAWPQRPSRSDPGCGTDGSGQYKTPDMPDSVRHGLWRPGGAFFQIGLACVMSHHQLPHRRALQILVLILVGKFKVKFLPTVSH